MPIVSNTSNHFLKRLSSHDQDLLRPHLRPAEFAQGLVLYAPHDEIARVYLPQSGVISIVTCLSDGQFVEAGMFGRNGAIGGGAAVDGRLAINQAVVQAQGEGLTIETALLSQLLHHSESLRMALMSQEQMIYAHTQQIVACNAVHRLEERLCRWLLQARDLIMSETLPLTQEFLAQMLGVQRSSVTLIARRLQESGLITYRRGTIQVLDVEALRDSSCECYAAINAHFERLVGWRPDF